MRERIHPQIRLIEGPEPAVEAEAEAIDEARDIKGGVELKAVGARGAVPNDVHEEQAAIGGSLHIVGGVANIEHLAPLPALLRQDMRGGIGARLVRPPVRPAHKQNDERRVGKECVSTCRSRCSTYHSQKNNTK